MDKNTRNWLFIIASGAKRERSPARIWIPNGGADLYAGKGDHSDSPYYGHPDYFHLTSNDHLTILSHYKTFQQTAEYTCGPASILMALYHLGITSYTERSLAIGMKTSCDQQTGGLPGTADEPGEYGTSIPNMVELFKDGFLTQNRRNELSEKAIAKAI
jgi:hypothetical protein